MLLSILRHFESDSDSEDLTCLDLDMELSIEICRVLAMHAEHLSKKLGRNYSTVPANKAEFHEMLPANPKPFGRADAVKIGNALGMCPKTVDNTLKDSVLHGSLKKVKTGIYMKASS
jgi:hypothetical protein